jgi:hypothetical protein
MKRIYTMLGIAVGLPLLGANVASAGFSTIGASINPSEPSHADIFGDVLGGSFVADGLNFTSGSIAATRVDDGLDKTFPTAGTLTKVAGYTSKTDTVTFTDGKFRLERGDGTTFTSDPADNVDGRDHLVTYALSGAASGYVLFFEDANGLRPNADFDYNDVVLSSVASVPLPGAFAAGLVCLGGMGAARVVRRKR